MRSPKCHLRHGIPRYPLSHQYMKMKSWSLRSASEPEDVGRGAAAGVLARTAKRERNEAISTFHI